MRTKWTARSVFGGLTSMPMTEKSPIWDKSRRPRFPETPVTTTTGLLLSITVLETPDSSSGSGLAKLELLWALLLEEAQVVDRTRAPDAWLRAPYRAFLA